MTTLLTLCQAVSTELQLPVVNAVTSSSSVHARRLLRYANKAGVILYRTWDWPQLRNEVTFVTTATELQSGVTPSDFGRMVPETMQNRTTGKMIDGPVSPRVWQMAKTNNPTEPIFTLRSDPATNMVGVYMLPAPSAGDTVAYEYVSKNWVLDAADDGKAAFTADTDTCLFDDDLMITQMCMRWLMAEGQPSAHMENEHKSLMEQISKQDNPTGGILVTDIPRNSRWNIYND